MPYHTGVLAASILLVVGLGINMTAFPEVWKMLRNDSPSSVAMADHKDTSLAPSIPSDSAKQPVPEPVRAAEAPKDAKPISVDKPIPVDQPPPKPVEPAPPPKPASAPETPPKPVEPAPPPKPASAPETPPKPVEPAPSPKPTPAPETPPKPVVEVPVEKKPDASVRAAAFAPIVPLGLLASEHKESLLPTTESAEAFSASVGTPAPSVAAPAYAKKFKAAESPPPPFAAAAPPFTPSRSTPIFETLDSALAAPIVYESHPTIERRVAESSAPKIVPLPKESTGASLQSFAPMSPTGAVKRLPTTN